MLPLPFRLNAGRIRGLIPDVEPSTDIPKHFYQTYRQRDLPGHLLVNRDKIVAMNPHWSYRFFDDDQCREFIESEYGRPVLAYYDAITGVYGASRADFFRYLLIYKTGGLYLDIKSTASRPFDAILLPSDRYLLSGWDPQDEETGGWGQHPELSAAGTIEYQQWHVIAARGHPYLKNVIERVLHNIDSYVPEVHGTGAHGVFRVTGPIAYSLAIAEMASLGQHRLIAGGVETGLVYSAYSGATVHRQAAHYSKQVLPITKLDQRRRLVGTAVRVIRRCWKVMRRLPLLDRGKAAVVKSYTRTG